jgi:hypothetical protein
MKHKTNHFLLIILCTLLTVSTPLHAVITNVVDKAGTFTNDELTFSNGSSFTETLYAGSYFINSSTEIVLSDGETKISETIAFLAPFLGAIIMYANETTALISAYENSSSYGNAIKMSVLPCNGLEVTANWYPQLNGVLGQTWGVPLNGDNFVLPLLDNFYLRGDELSGGDAPDPARDINYTARNETVNFDGAETSGVGSYQNYQVQAHKHTFSSVSIATTVYTGSHGHTTDREVFITSIAAGHGTQSVGDGKVPSSGFPNDNSTGDTGSSFSSSEGSHYHDGLSIPPTLTMGGAGAEENPILPGYGLTMFIFAGPYDNDAVNDALGY